MKFRNLGNSKLQISEVGLGTWAFGGPVKYQGHSVGWRAIEKDVALATLKSALDHGVNFIDTADIYGRGRAESYIGDFLKNLGPVGKDLVITSKVGFDLDGGKPIGQNQDFSEKHIRKSCEASLKRLQREVIDLYQLHCVPMDVIEKGEAFDVLRQLKKEGKIRAFGVSIIRDEEALAAIKDPEVCSVQIIFNIFRQKPIQTVFPVALEKGVGILARVPLASGLLTGKFKSNHKFEDGDHRKEGIPGETFSGVPFARGLEAAKELMPLAKPGERTLGQAALGYTLSFDAVSSTIPGAVTPEQAVQNALASELPVFSQQERALCQRVYQNYFQKKMERRF